MAPLTEAFRSLFETNMGVQPGERIVVFSDIIRSDETPSPPMLTGAKDSSKSQARLRTSPNGLTATRLSYLFRRRRRPAPNPLKSSGGPSSEIPW